LLWVAGYVYVILLVASYLCTWCVPTCMFVCQCLQTYNLSDIATYKLVDIVFA